jgi:transposase
LTWKRKAGENSAPNLKLRWPWKLSGNVIRVEEIARKHELHPTQINSWKKEFLNKAAAVFEAENPEKDAQKEADTEKLYAQIGQLKMKNDWLKKKLQ